MEYFGILQQIVSRCFPVGETEQKQVEMIQKVQKACSTYSTIKLKLYIHLRGGLNESFGEGSFGIFSSAKRGCCFLLLGNWPLTTIAILWELFAGVSECSYQNSQ